MSDVKPGLLSMCGINCSKCEGYIATQRDDDALREKVAKKWAVEYGYPDLKAEQINCDGCTAPGKKFGNCEVCKVRLCGLGKGLKICVDCADYPCGDIAKLHKDIPEAKGTCDRLAAERTK